MIVAETYIRVKVGAPQEGEYGLSWPQISGGLPGTVFKFYEISSYILPIFQLLFEIFFIVMVMGLYKKYAAKNYMTFSMLSLFVPLSRYVLIFVIRNNKAIDYEAYMRAQREAYMRRQQQYYNTSYNNPYNRYGNAPYGNGEYGVNQQRTEEPFSEFSSREKAGNPFEEFNKTDDFFN